MAFCSNCGAELVGQFCAKCGTHASGQAMASVAPAPAIDWRVDEMRRLKDRLQTERHGIPALLSFFIPGLGQMIKGQFLLGVAVMIFAAGFAALCFVGIGIPLLGILWIAQLHDAYVKPDAELAAEVKRVLKRPSGD